MLSAHYMQTLHLSEVLKIAYRYQNPAWGRVMINHQKPSIKHFSMIKAPEALQLPFGGWFANGKDGSKGKEVNDEFDLNTHARRDRLSRRNIPDGRALDF
jgi:hypothetical protein